MAVQAQVGIPQQQCVDQPAIVQQRTSGDGALLGALVGGVIGHNLGDGFGRSAATGLGVVVGSVVGDRTEAASTPMVEVPLRTCQNSTRYETRVMGCDVVYEYSGQRYSTRLAQDPGAQVALNVSVGPVGQSVAVGPTVVYVAPPVYGYNANGGLPIVLAPQLEYGRYWRRGY